MKSRRLPTDEKLSKMDNLLSLPLVEVEWRDASSHHGWGTLRESRASADTIPCQTTGRLIKRSRSTLTVAQTIGEHGQLAECWSIPTSWVTKVRILR